MIFSRTPESQWISNSRKPFGLMRAAVSRITQSAEGALRANLPSAGLQISSLDPTPSSRRIA